MLRTFLSAMSKNSCSNVRYVRDPSSDSKIYNCQTYEDLRVTSKGNISENMLVHHADASCSTEKGQAEQTKVLIL